MANESADLLDLICGLLETPRAMIGASLLSSHGGAAERLTAMGLARPGSAPRTIACRACDKDHAATPNFDSVAGRFFIFCPVAGRVEVEPNDLETLEVRPRAIVDHLVAAFPVVPAISRELVARKVWHLGEAVIGGTSLTLIFARRIGSRRALSALASAVATVPATEIGMIVTSSPFPDPQLVLPNRYAVIGLRDIAVVQQDRLEINRPRVAAYIRAVRENKVRLHAGGGRPSGEAIVVEVYHRRRRNGAPFVSIMGEARAIVSDLAEIHPDYPPPAVSTVRRHLGKLRSSRP